MLDLSRITTTNLAEKKVMIKETTVHEKLIHEHDFAVVQNGNKTSCCYRIQCVTCDEYFCQLCGKTDCSCVVRD